MTKPKTIIVVAAMAVMSATAAAAGTDGIIRRDRRIIPARRHLVF